MKNCRFSMGQSLVIQKGMYLLFALFLTLGSCQKDYLSDVPADNAGRASVSFSGVERASDLDNDVNAYAQWMIDKVIPLVSDKQAFDDIKAGNYGSPAVQTRLNALGFSGYAAFATAFQQKGSVVTAAMNAGTLNSEQVKSALSRTGALNFTGIDIGGTPPEGLAPGTPCYDQYVIDLITVAAEVAIASTAGPWFGIATGLVGIAAAHMSFKNCLKANYP